MPAPELYLSATGQARRRRAAPAWLRACRALAIGLPLALIGAAVCDADSFLDDLPPGLLYLAATSWLIALGVMAIDLTLIVVDRRVRSTDRRG